MERDVAAGLDPQQLVAMASHDLSEPLRTIEGFARVLRDRAGDRLDESERGLLDEVVAGTERMRELLDAVLDWSRLQGGAGGRTLIDAGALVEEVVRSLTARTVAADARVVREALPSLWGDRAQLGLVFQNLVANAVVHGGGDVHVSAEPEGRGWMFAVADRGPGVPEAERQAIFGLFSRGRGGRSGPGTGIGLAVCAQIVANHGGRIWVEPREGGGSVFRFTVPQRSARRDAPPPAPAAD